MPKKRWTRGLRGALRCERRPRDFPSLLPSVRISSSALLVLLGFVSTAAAVPVDVTKSSSEGRSRPGRAGSPVAVVGKAWLLGGTLKVKEAKFGSVAVANPVIVEVLSNGLVRAKDAQGRTWTGEAGFPIEFTDGSVGGLRLYARQRTAIYRDDLELSENGARGSPPWPPFAPVTGPAIAYARQGVPLMVVRMSKTYTEVMLSGWEGSQLRALVATADLDLKRTASATSAEPAVGRLVRDHKRTLFTKPGDAGQEITKTTCGPMRVLEDRVIEGNRWQRVVQENGGVQLEGWVGVEGMSLVPIETARGDHRCSPRTIKARVRRGEDESREGPTSEAQLPPGFVAMERDVAGLGRRLGALAQSGAKVFVPVVAGEGVRCAEYAFVDLANEARFWSGARSGESAQGLGLRREDKESGQRITYGVASLDSALGLALSGPLLEEGGRTLVGGRSSTYVIASLTRDALALVPCSGWCEPIAAYHRDDVELWFLERGECQRRGSIANSSGFLR
jgi:hypothetical protein